MHVKSKPKHVYVTYGRVRAWTARYCWFTTGVGTRGAEEQMLSKFKGGKGTEVFFFSSIFCSFLWTS